MLQTTVLINKSFVRLTKWHEVEWQNRAHVLGVSATLLHPQLSATT